MDNKSARYQPSRQRFAAIVYLLTFVWLVLAVIQWLFVNLIPFMADTFKDSEWISCVFFAMAIILTMVFIFYEASRFMKCVNWILAILIVEFLIVGVHTLIARSIWPELILWFFVCLILLYFAILLGSVIPHDMTLDIVILFVISFTLLVTSVFLIMLHVATRTQYSIILYQIVVSFIILAFVMYHAQTINGERFAEMRVSDYLLATIILFYDFTVLFMLTFYAQTNFNIVSLNMANNTTNAPTGSNSSQNSVMLTVAPP